MTRTFTLGQQLVAGFILPVLSLVLLGWLSYSGTVALLASSEQVNHNHQVIAELAGLLTSVENAETQQRGFLISGQEEFLDEYRRAVTAIERSYERLTTLE